jgi:hypothetical protein
MACVGRVVARRTHHSVLELLGSTSARIARFARVSGRQGGTRGAPDAVQVSVAGPVA